MNLTLKLAAFGLAASLSASAPAFAQDEPPVLPDRTEVEAGETFIAGIYRDWQVRCIRAPELEVPDRCEMFQLLEEESGNPVAEFRIAAAIQETEEEIASATILTPLDTLLSPGLQVQIDDSPPAQVPYAFCRPIGCFVQLSLSADDLELFTNGADAFFTIFALIRDESGQMGGVPVETSASLRGFTAALEDVQGRVGEIRAFIEAQQTEEPASE